MRRSLCVALLVVAGAAHAQPYPSRPIRSIMTVAGGADIIARSVAQGLTQSLGQPVVVETQSGAGGAIGAETVALVVTSPALPVNSMQGLIEYAKRHPGKLSYGTSGIGTTHHLSGESIRLLTGIDWVHVPYKGGPPVITDLIGGEIQVGFSILATAAPFLASGKIRVLAVNGAKRYHVIPNVPTVAEQLPGYEPPSTWGGYFGPAGMPQAIVVRLHDEIARILNSPEVRTKAEDIGFPVATSTPEELLATIRRDIEYTARIVKAVGIRPE